MDYEAKLLAKSVITVRKKRWVIKGRGNVKAGVTEMSCEILLTEIGIIENL